MRFTKLISFTLISLLLLASVSCKKKNVKKLQVNNQFAISLMQDDITMNEILGMMDSTVDSWLRVRNDSIFAFYCDTVFNVVNGNDIFGKIDDQTFNTSTQFDVVPVPPIPDPSLPPIETTLVYGELAVVPFTFDGFGINTVAMRDGKLVLDLSFSPAFDVAKRVVLTTGQIIMQNGLGLEVELIINNGSAHKEINLEGCTVTPDNAGNINFAGAIDILYYPNEGITGGTYGCEVTCGLKDIAFMTLEGIITHNVDTIFNDTVAIDFGIKHLTGNGVIKMPQVVVTRNNTFDLGAEGIVNFLQFENSKTGYATNLLSTDEVDVVINPTNGNFEDMNVVGLANDIDIMAGYDKLEFAGKVQMKLDEGTVTINDDSHIDLGIDIELPLAVKIDDLVYKDTIPLKLSNEDFKNNLFDGIDFFVDFTSQIPLDIDVQAIFLKDNVVVDSLFEAKQYIRYHQHSTIKAAVDDDRLRTVMECNKLLLRIGISTDEINDEYVMFRTTDDLKLGIRMRTRITDIDIDEFIK